MAQEATPGAAGVDGVQPDGSWAFTDDRGVRVTAPELPTRVVAQTSAAAALWDFGVQVVGIYGPNRRDDGTVDFQAGNLDLDAVEVLGDYGTDSLEIDIEKFVELAPDLVVDMVLYGESFWYLTGDALARVEERGVPTAGISLGETSILTSIMRFEALAAALGADLSAPLVADAKTAHAASETALKAAIASKPGLSLLVIAPDLDNVYVASPRYMADLMYFQDLGVVDHETDDFFELISWEEINRYPADIILVDARNATVSKEEIADVAPIWNTLPAVQAGQVGNWWAGAPYSYSRLIPILDELTGVIAAADPNVVAE